MDTFIDIKRWPHILNKHIKKWCEYYDLNLFKDNVYARMTMYVSSGKCLKGYVIK